MQKTLKSFDGTKINYEILRKKSKLFLIFLHGAGGNLRAWKKERAYLHRKNISTLAMDLRGHGFSGRPAKESQYELPCFIKDLELIIEQEKINDFILVGHCFGGMITIKYAKMYPEKAKAYTLVDTTYRAPHILSDVFEKHPFIIKILNARLEQVKINDNFKKDTDYDLFAGTGDLNPIRIYEDIKNTTFKSWFFIYENIAKFDGVEALESIVKPTLIVEGEEDKIFNTSVAKKLKNLVKASKIDIIPKANHVLVVNNPKELEKIIYNFTKHFL